MEDAIAEGARIFEVRGMTCATCARRVERAITKVEGVERAEVDLVRERARVVAPATVPDETLARSVESLGYHLAPLRSARAEPSRSGPRPDAVRAGVALVLAGSAMAAAMIPGAPGRPWLEIVLAAIAVLGPGAPILVKALRESIARAASMDTLVSIGALAALGSAIATALAHGAHAHGYAESAATIVAFVLLGRALDDRARARAGDALRALSSVRPDTARVIRHGAEAEIPASELREADEVRVRANERIPADGEIVSEDDAWVDEAWLSGESAPVRKTTGDRLLAGTLASGSSLRMRVTASGAATELARVERLVDAAQSSRAPIVRIADRVGAIFVPVVLALASITLVVWIAVGRGVEGGISAAITVLVVACPCALGLAAPAAITVAVGRAASLGILVRDAAAIERLARVRVIAIDKTGTLTEGRPILAGALALDGDLDRALSLAAAIELESEHPIGRAIVSAAMDRGLVVPAASSVEARTSIGVRGSADGARVEVRALAETDAVGGEARARVAAWRADACTVVIAAIDDRPVALFAVRDAIRPRSREAIARLRALGLVVRIHSGDHASSVGAIARELDLDPGSARAAMRPEDKASALVELRAEHGPIAMVGDGVNDAPALAAADVGIAIGTGAEAARRSADVTLVRPDPERIADAIALARRTVRVVRQSLALAFLYNAVMVPLAAIGALEPVGGPMLASALMAASSVTVVANALRLRRA